MKLVFFGTAEFAVPALRRLAPYVALVVAQPDRPSGRKMQLHPSPVKAAAAELGLPCETPERCREPRFIEHIAALGADALVVAAYGQIMPERLLSAAKRGGINLHGSLLPKYRGAAPIQRAIFEGESETGVTLMQMDKGMDTGDAIATVATPIGPDETAGELFVRLAELAADLAEAWMPRIVVGDYPRLPQDREQATYAPKIAKEEARIVVASEARREYDRFRAFTPSPGAFLETVVGHVRLSEARLNPASGEPGTLLALDPVPLLACACGALELRTVQPEGKKRMSGRDFANGARLTQGMTLVPQERTA